MNLPSRSAIALLIFVGACRLPPVARPYPAPSASDVYQTLVKRATDLDTLRIEARADQMGPGTDRLKVHVNVVLAKGARLRVEAENPLGGPLATLVTDGEQFALLDARANRFLVGAAQACNVARMLGVELPPAEIIATLAGGAPLNGEPRDLTWDPENGGHEVLTLATSDGGTERLVLAPHTWEVQSAERHDQKGQLVWRVTHDDFEGEGAAHVPRHTEIEQPPKKTDLRLRYRNVSAGEPAAAEIFHLAPAGLPPEMVTCP